MACNTIPREMESLHNSRATHTKLTNNEITHVVVKFAQKNIGRLPATTAYWSW